MFNNAPIHRCLLLLTGVWSMWSPEMCLSSVSDAPYSAFKADIWATGVILFAMVFGKPPFWDSDPGVLLEQILATTQSDSCFEYPAEVSITAPLQQLLEQLFHSSSALRPSFTICRGMDWLQPFANEFLTKESVSTSAGSSSSSSTLTPTPGNAKYKSETSEDRTKKQSAKEAKKEKKIAEKKLKHKLIDSNGHFWVPKYFNKPTWCPICDDFIFGLTKDMQKSYKCRECKTAGHLKCVINYNSHVACTKSTNSCHADKASMMPKISHTYNPEPVPNVGGHVWRKVYLKAPTWCKVCNSFIYGVTKEQQNAFRCLLCKTIGHRNCCEYYNDHGCSIGQFGVQAIKHNSIKKRPPSKVTRNTSGEIAQNESVCVFVGVVLCCVAVLQYCYFFAGHVCSLHVVYYIV
jgi:hypothetical protein